MVMPRKSGPLGVRYKGYLDGINEFLMMLVIMMMLLVLVGFFVALGFYPA